MNLIDILLLLSTLFYVFLSSLLLFKGHSRKEVVLLALISISSAFWVSGIIAFRIIPFNKLSWLYFSNKEFIVASAFIATFFLHFALVFTKANQKKIISTLIYIPAIAIFFFCDIPNFFIREILLWNWGRESVLGYGYIYFGLFIVGYYLAGLYFLFITERSAKGNYKNQLLYIILATALTGFIDIWFNLILILMGNYKYIWVGPYSSFVWISVLSYAITKEDLFDIKIVINRTAARILTNAFFISVYGLSLYAFWQYSGSRITPFFIVFTIIFGIVVGEWYKPVCEIIQTGLIDKWITDFYDQNVLLASISKRIGLLSEREDILSVLAEEFMLKIRIPKAVLIERVIKGSSETIFMVKVSYLRNKKEDTDNEKNVFYITAEHLAKPIELTGDFISSFSDNTPISFSKLSGVAQSQLQPFEFDKEKGCIIPLFSEQKEGFLVLDKRVSETAYSKKDIQFFDMIQNYLAEVFKRLKPYEEIKIHYESTKYQLHQSELALLQAKKEEAERANHYKSQFLAQMTHDLRTPLHVVIGLLDILSRSNRIMQDEEISKPITIALKSAEKQLNLVNTILDLSKVESGKLEARLESFAVNDLFDGLVEQAHTLLKDKPVIFSIENEILSTNPLIIADKTQLHQVLINLLSNSTKFTEKGKITLTISKKKEDNQLRLYFRFQDTGIGMSPENVERLFTSYTQIENELQKKYKGTGLGLTICKGFIEAHQGKIWAESELGKGTSFIFWIPYIESSSDELKKTIEIPRFDKEKALKSIQRIRLLMIDDDEFNLSFAQMILEGKLQYDLVNNGQDGIEKAKHKKYDLIFIDLNMPEMDGRTVFRKIRAFDAKTPIIALTAEAMIGTKEQLALLGFSGYLAKPFKEEDLLAFISKNING